MRLLTAGLCLAFAIAASVPLSAGQIYGTIVADDQPLKDTDIEIKCGDEAPLKGKTAAVTISTSEALPPASKAEVQLGVACAG